MVPTGRRAAHIPLGQIYNARMTTHPGMTPPPHTHTMAEQLVGLLRGVTKVAIIVTLLLVTLPPTAIYHVFTYLHRRPPYSLKRHVIANLMRVAGTNASRVTLPPRDATAAMIPKNKYTTSPEWTVEVRMVQPLDADVPRLPIIKQVGDKVKEVSVPVFMVAPAVRTCILLCPFGVLWH